MNWMLILANILALNNVDRVCAPENVNLDPARMMRSISLDLRGVVPELDEVRSAAESSRVPEAWLDEVLASESFDKRFVRWHREIFWNNVDKTRVLGGGARLRRTLVDGVRVYWVVDRADSYRGDRVPCRGEPAAFLPDQTPLTVSVVGTTGLETQREGYVEVAPYWAPETTVRVCAFDAQEVETSVTGVACASTAAVREPGCGCGPELKWCASDAVDTEISRSFTQSFERRLYEISRRGGSYLELFTDRTGYVNGPLVHYWRNLVFFHRGLRNFPLPVDLSVLPDLPYEDSEFYPIDLGLEHVGVLTEPAFLLRFQTNRARASRVFDALMCQPLQAVAGALPAADDTCSLDPDLQTRCGCAYCHAILEPAAAHWGRWVENGAGYLPVDLFPRERADCSECAKTGARCAQECRLYYAVDRRVFPREELGQLGAYVFRRAEHERFVEDGPWALIAQGVADNRLPLCVVRRAAARLLGSEVAEVSTADAEEWTRMFVKSGFNYRQLIKAIVQSESYRRVR